MKNTVLKIRSTEQIQWKAHICKCCVPCSSPLRLWHAKMTAAVSYPLREREMKGGPPRALGTHMETASPSFLGISHSLFSLPDGRQHSSKTHILETSVEMLTVCPLPKQLLTRMRCSGSKDIKVYVQLMESLTSSALQIPTLGAASCCLNTIFQQLLKASSYSNRFLKENDCKIL